MQPPTVVHLTDTVLTSSLCAYRIELLWKESLVEGRSAREHETDEDAAAFVEAAVAQQGGPGRDSRGSAAKLELEAQAVKTPYKASPPPCDGTLAVTLHRVVGLTMVANGDDIARPDPYAVLRLKGPKGARPQRSSALVKTVQPAFDQRFQFFVPGEQLVSLGMQLWSSEEGQSDQFLGSAQLNICHLFQDHWEAQASGSEPYTAEMVETEIALEDPDKKVKVVDGATEGEYGRAFVSVEFAPNPEEEAIPAEPEAQGGSTEHTAALQSRGSTP